MTVLDDLRRDLTEKEHIASLCYEAHGRVCDNLARAGIPAQYWDEEREFRKSVSVSAMAYREVDLARARLDGALAVLEEQ
jgi:hypothetical protein